MERHIYRINGQGYVNAESAEAARSAWRKVFGECPAVITIEQLKPTAVVAMFHPGGVIKHTCDEWISLSRPGYMFAEGYA